RNGLGLAAFGQADYNLALICFQEAFDIAKQGEDKSLMFYPLYNLGEMEQLQGNYERAVTLLQESLVLSLDVGDVRQTVLCVEMLAGARGCQGQAERAVRLYGAADRQRETIGFLIRPVERSKYDRDVSTVCQVLGDETFAIVWAEGHALTLEQAIA